MPNLLTHLNLALRAVAVLNDPGIDRDVGSFLLGSTAPDIRAVTKWSRDTTHFASLEVEGVGAGADGLFYANPALLNVVAESEVTRAFVAGYICHLVADETWITKIYRPYFGNHDVFPDPMEAKIYDRAFQLELDRAALEQIGSMEVVVEALHESDLGIDVGFIDATTLNVWMLWVMDFGRRPFDWDRLYFLTRRIYGDNHTAETVVGDFLASVKANLEWAYQRVPEDRLREFEEEAVSESIRLINMKLNGYLRS